MMTLLIIVVLIATAFIACEAYDEGGHWLFWTVIGCLSAIMTYFVFR